MSLTPSPEREELRSVVRKFLVAHSDEEQVRRQMDLGAGFDASTWKLMAQQIGIQSLMIPEEYGGAGFGFGEMAIVLEEAGRALLCAPLLSTVLATTALLSADDDAAAAALLPGIADGTVIATVASADDNDPGPDGVRLAAEPAADGAGWRLTGTKPYVLDGADAALIIVAARTPAGVSLFLVDSGADGFIATNLPTLDLTRRLASLEFADTPATLLGGEGAGSAVCDQVLRTAAVALACEQVGGAAKVLETTVEYVKTREQFGRPIGSFQAVKHRLADMLVQLESARSAAYFATAALESESDEAPVAASIAKSYCSSAYYDIAAESIQLHGGIGFTWEHSAHLYFKRAKGSQTMFGTPAYHRRLIAVELGV